MRVGNASNKIETAEMAGAGWLPHFCNAPTLFAVMVVAELVALVIVLAPGMEPYPWLPRLGVTSVYVQWLALLNAVVLCSLRRLLQPFATRSAFLIAWLVSIAVTALASAVVCRIDQALGLNFSVAPAYTQRFVLANAAICALIAAALLRYLFVLEQWRERVSAASKARFDALQARIRPHFLFNSMNTIASLIRSRPAEAERTVEDLSDLFRAALGANDTLSTLGEEIDLALRYLHIEQLRLGDRLGIDLQVADAPRDLRMPRLLLQPLVENAVYHGIQTRAEGGIVSVHARRLSDAVEIVVRNPLPPEIPLQRNGMALANTRARIEYHFGERGQLRVEPAEGSFTVTMRLPETPVQ